MSYEPDASSVVFEPRQNDRNWSPKPRTAPVPSDIDGPADAVSKAEFDDTITSEETQDVLSAIDAELRKTGRLPTQQEAAEAARTILHCNGHDLTQWGGDNLHDDSAQEALKALAAQRARK